MNEHVKCKNCIYYFPLEDALGECRQHPPWQVVSKTTFEFFKNDIDVVTKGEHRFFPSLFVIVTCDTWCGSFQALVREDEKECITKKY